MLKPVVELIHQRPVSKAEGGPGYESESGQSRYLYFLFSLFPSRKARERERASKIREIGELPECRTQ